MSTINDDRDRAAAAAAAAREDAAARGFGRLVLMAGLGALAAAACVLAAYALWPTLALTMDVDPPLTRGLYPVERGPDGLTFAWSRDQVTVLLPDIDRHMPWRLTLRYRGSRPNDSDLPEVRVMADDVMLGQQRASNEFQELVVTLPRNDTKPRGARVTIQVSATFTPGPTDPRPLGIIVDEIRVRPSGRGLPIAPWRLLFASAIAGALCGIMFGLIDLTAFGAAIATGIVAIVQALVVSAGAGPYTAYADVVPKIAFWVAAATVLTMVVARWWAGAPLRRTARFVLACSGGVLFLKLLILLHPNMPIGDALFQAHRFEWVRDGRWLFTSIAPGGYEFPYSIALYVVSLPFASLIPVTAGSLGIMVLLRIIVAVADAIAGGLLYPIVTKHTGDRLAGAIAVGLFHLIPLNFQVQTVGNLTNAFGQSMFVIAIGAMLLGLLQPRAYGRLALLTIVMSVALLSHTSTFAIAAPAFVLIAIAFWWRGKPEVRPLALPLLACTIVSVVIAVALYYGHFGETYLSMWKRISGEMAAPAQLSDPGGRSVGQRAAAVPYFLNIYFGWPALVLAIAGLACLRRRDALTLTTVGWLAAAGLFLVLGVLTPVDMRYYLAAFPAVALVSSFGASHGWRRGPVFQSAAIVLLGAAVLLGARHALATLR